MRRAHFLRWCRFRSCALPSLDNGQLRIETDPGRRAEAEARAKGEINRFGRKKYIEAMKAWLNDIHIAVTRHLELKDMALADSD